MTNRTEMLIRAVECGFHKTAEGAPLRLDECRGGEAEYEVFGRGSASKNLIPYPYRETTKTTNGITFTDNGDGSITANGTATANAMFIINNNLFPIMDKDKKYTLSSGYGNGNMYLLMSLYKGSKYVSEIGTHIGARTFDLSGYDADKIQCIIYVRKGSVADGVVFKPQLEVGNTATEFEKYENRAVGDYDHSCGKYVIPLTVYGKNLIPYPYMNTTKITNGITFTDNGDGSVTASGTATANAQFVLNSQLSVPKGKYYLSGMPTGASRIYINITVYNGNTVVKPFADKGIGCLADLSETEFTRLNMYIIALSGAVIDTVCIRPQLEVGDAATEFEPYTEPKTIKLELSAPLGEGESISSTADNLPGLKLNNGTNTVIAETKIPPQKISVSYVSKVRA